jgi:hypothetical protein
LGTDNINKTYFIFVFYAYPDFQVSLLTSVPEFDMVQYLPEIMDGLFHILGDPNPEIRKS